MPPNLIVDLPLKIRLVVYEYAVVKYVTQRRVRHTHGYTCRLVPPPLARVNKLLREEVTHLYYTKNEFWIPLPIANNNYYAAFRARCEIVADFIPMMRSLRAEVCPGAEEATWSILFEEAEPDSQHGVRIADTVVPGHAVYGRPRPATFYWQMLDEMFRTMQPEHMLQWEESIDMPGNNKAVNHDVVIDALHMLTKRSYLAELRLEALFCEMQGQ